MQLEISNDYMLYARRETQYVSVSLHGIEYTELNPMTLEMGIAHELFNDITSYRARSG